MIQSKTVFVVLASAGLLVLDLFAGQVSAKPAAGKRKANPTPSQQIRKLTIDKKYLLLPVRNGARKCRVDLVIDGKAVRQFDIELAAKAKPSFWSFLDLTAFKGKKATLQVSGASKAAVDNIVQSDTIRMPKNLYDEPLRPQFHFSQKVGWNQDPNGLVYYDGEWHLYFQHNPYGWNNANAHWGHAVSKDLIHWEQLPIAMYNKNRGDRPFSGHAIIDKNNVGGWQRGKEKVIVASWTSNGRGQCISYSNDRGRTFTEYKGNPVIKDPSARDPKILWYKPGKHWVMVVFEKLGGPNMAFYTSANLKDWKLQSRLMDWFVCPELIELPVDGDPDNTRWVVFAFDASYAIGKFDGKTFTPGHKGKHKVHYGMQKEKPVFCYRASQVFNNAPDGRTIQLGWAKIWMPGMPFNQAFSFPHELTLRTTKDGVRMFAEPVKEIEKLYKNKHSAKNKMIAEGRPVRLNVSGDIFDVTATFEPGDAKVLGLDIGGNRIKYSVKTGRLQDAPLKPVDGKVTIRALMDRPIMEINGNHGRVVITTSRAKKGEVRTVEAFAVGGTAKLVKIEVNKLESIWKK